MSYSSDKMQALQGKSSCLFCSIFSKHRNTPKYIYINVLTGMILTYVGVTNSSKTIDV